MGFSLHASNTDDPPAVRNWRIHLMAIIVSMGSIAMGYDTSVIGGTSKFAILNNFHDLVTDIIQWLLIRLGEISDLTKLPSMNGIPYRETSCRHSKQGRSLVRLSMLSTEIILMPPGALLTFPLGEKFGRKRAIMFASFIFLIGGTLMVSGVPQNRGHEGLLYRPPQMETLEWSLEAEQSLASALALCLFSFQSTLLKLHHLLFEVD
jgi:hypothetical protein